MSNFLAKTIAVLLSIGLNGQLVAQSRFRLADPQSLSGAGSGWTVEPGTGALSFAIPIASVPGEISVPAIFTIAASHTAQLRKAWSSEQVGTRVIWTLDAQVNLHNPVLGTLHFGYIDNGGNINGIANSATYVLEDGAQFRQEDWIAFTNYSSTFTLPQDFQLASVAPGSVMVSSNRTYAYYMTSAAGLGSTVSAKVQATLPVGHAAPTQYCVILDKDRARVMAYLSGLNAWAPLLWLDRFGHQVAFKWTMGTSGLPAGATALHSVVATNQRPGQNSRGIQIQWATWADGTTERDLLRADFIGVDAPSILVKGYSGQASAPPVGFTYTSAPNGDVMVNRTVAGVIGRPTVVQVGNSTMVPEPVWVGSGSSLPAVPPMIINPPPQLPLLQWQIAYDANKAAITGFTDALGVTTQFEYSATATFPYPYAQGTHPTYGNAWNHAVTGATSTDSQQDPVSVTIPQLKRTWSRTAVVNNSWTTTYQEWWPSVGPAERKIEFGFGSATQPVLYGNTALALQRVLSADGAIEYSKTVRTLDVGGLTGDETITSGIEVSRKGEASYRVGYGYANGKPNLQTRLAGPSSGILGGETALEQTSTLYDVKKDKLDVGRPIQVTITRSNGSGTTLTPSRVMMYEYDTTTRQLKKTYLDGGASDGQLGSNTTYDSEGRVYIRSNFASFSTEGVATTTLAFAPDGYPSGSTTVYTRPANQVGANSISESSSYDSAGRIRTQVDPRGVSMTLEYDTLGRLTSRSRQGESLISYSYPSLRLSQISQNNLTASSLTDGFGRLLRRTLPDGRKTEYYYDSHGRVVIQKDFTDNGGSSRSSSTSYDPLDRPTGYNSPGGSSQSVTYSATSDLKQSIVATGVSGLAAGRKEYRDVLDQVVRTEEPSGGVSTLTYDGAGQLQSISTTDASPSPNTQTRTFTTNALGLLISKVEPELGSQTQPGTQTFGGFNALGMPTLITEASGTSYARVRTVLYDGLGRVCKVSSNLGSDTVDNFFDGPLLMSASEGGANPVSMQFTYGPVTAGARLVSESTTMAGISTAMRYNYLPSGQLDTIAYPSGRLVGYSYDAFGRITGIQDRTGGGSSAIVSNVGFDGWGQRSRLTFGSTAYSDWSTQDMGTHLKDWTIGYTTGGLGDTANPRAHTYDLAERLTKAGEWQGLLHDSANRLGHAEAPSLGVTAIDLNHDVFGNNITQSVSGTSAPSFNSFSFPPLAATNQLPSGSSGWVVNGRGEATAMNQGTSTSQALGLTWDALGRVSQVNTNFGTTQSNTYAPSGMRIRVVDSSSPINNRRFAYTSGGLLMSEYGGAATGASVHSGQKAVRLQHVGNLGWSAFSRYLGNFQAGDTVTATAWFRAPAGVYGEVFLGDAGGANPYDNSTHSYINGNGGWQSITLSWTMTHSDDMWIYIYGNQWTPTGYNTASDVDGPTVTWDDVTVSSAQQGLLFSEGFEGGVGPSWYVTSPYDLVTVGQDDPNAWRRDVIYLGSEAIAEIDASGIHELHNDHLGTPRIITQGATAQIEGKQAYGPFGEYLQGRIEGSYKPLTGYTGHLQTEVNGLIYMRGRFYSPSWHRFVNSDQGVDPNSWNQIAYVSGSPFMGTDPTGQIVMQIGTACVNYTTSFSWSDTHETFYSYSWTVCSPILGSVSANPGGREPGGASPQAPQPKLDAKKCAMIKKILAYEQKYGNKMAAYHFSPSFGGGSGFMFTNPTPYNNLTPTSVGPMDVDWYMELQTRMGWGPNIFGARSATARALYAGGKTLWEKMTSSRADSNGNYGEGKFQAESLYSDPGEGPAVWAAGQNLNFSDLWNADWLKANCP